MKWKLREQHEENYVISHKENANGNVSFLIKNIAKCKIIIEHINSISRYPANSLRLTKNGASTSSSNLSGYIYIYHDCESNNSNCLIEQSMFTGSGYNDYNIGPTLPEELQPYGKYIINFSNLTIDANGLGIVEIHPGFFNRYDAKDLVFSISYNLDNYIDSEIRNKIVSGQYDKISFVVYDLIDCKFAIKSREKYYNDISINNYNYDNNTYNNTSKLELNNDLDITDLCKDIIINGETFKPISKFGKFRIIKEV